MIAKKRDYKQKEEQDLPERSKVPLRAGESGEHAWSQSTLSLSSSLRFEVSSRQRCREMSPETIASLSLLLSSWTR
jgi:hypothetical protein